MESTIPFFVVVHIIPLAPIRTFHPFEVDFLSSGIIEALNVGIWLGFVFACLASFLVAAVPTTREYKTQTLERLHILQHVKWGLMVVHLGPNILFLVDDCFNCQSS